MSVRSRSGGPDDAVRVLCPSARPGAVCASGTPTPVAALTFTPGRSSAACS
jgi:hypothetical protein